ncbi:monoacylglycerol lipase abhd6-A-like [Branchiostoma floridae x Branchiostoma belcheri]
MEVMSTVVQLAGGAVLTTLTLAIYVIYIQPVYIISFFQSLNRWRSGCTIKYVKVGECQFAYMERGQPSENQPSLLFLHGFSDRKESYCGIIMHLPKHLHLIAVDLPGHGDTGIKAKADLNVEAYAAKLHQFVGEVGLDRGRLHVVGHSMGGGLAGCYTATYPETIWALTMICPGGILLPDKSLMFEKIARGNKHVMIPETVEQAEEMFNIVLHNKSLIPPKQVLKGYVDYSKPYRNFNKQLFDAMLEHGQDGLTPYLGKIAAPTQVIWGRHDQALHISSLDVMKKKITASLQVDIIEDCGHTVGLEAPTKVANLLLNFRETVNK